jgi:two-component system response regulator RegA
MNEGAIAGPGTGARLLVVDDDAAFNKVFCRVLGQRGFETAGALDSAEALRLAESFEPDYVVLDLNIGGQSGLRLIEPLLERCPGARIVMLTGYASIATAVDAVKLGAVQYLAKPADADSIVRALCEGRATDDVELGGDAPMPVDRLEWEHLQRVLNEHDGNISATARALKMHRRSLQRKLARGPGSPGAGY